MSNKEKLVDYDSCKELDPIFATNSISYNRIIAPLPVLIDCNVKNGLDYLIRQLMSDYKEIGNDRQIDTVRRKEYAFKINLDGIIDLYLIEGKPGVYVPVTRLADAICNLICIKNAQNNDEDDIMFLRNLYRDFILDVNEVFEYCKDSFFYDKNITVFKNEVSGAVVRKFNPDTKCIRIYSNEKSHDLSVREFVSTGYEYLTPDILCTPPVWKLEFETFDDPDHKAFIYKTWE